MEMPRGMASFVAREPPSNAPLRMTSRQRKAVRRSRCPFGPLPAASLNYSGTEDAVKVFFLKLVESYQLDQTSWQACHWNTKILRQTPSEKRSRNGDPLLFGTMNRAERALSRIHGYE